MSILNGLKDFFMPNEDEYAETPTESAKKEPEQPAPQPTATTTSSYESSTTSSAYNSREAAYTPPVTPTEDPRNNRVVNIKATTQLQVVLVKPELFTDAKQIADHLMANKTVVLNLESATETNRRRIIDFLVGVAYAQNGNIKPVANQTYIVTPYNVGFVGDEFVGELENNGLIM
jgi:cell division inhibitor SepF